MAKFVEGSGLRARNAARNPATPQTSLEAAARATYNAGVALYALTNPAVGEDVRREVVTPKVAHKLVSVGGSLGDAVVRANELAISNPWMAEKAGAWTPIVRRGILGLPQLTQDQVHAASSGGVGRQGNVARHPAMMLLDHPNMVPGESVQSPTERACLGNPAQDLILANDPDTTAELASQVLFRSAPPPEPHIIGRLLTRFGLQAFAPSSYFQHAESRLRAAGWVAPLADYVSVAALEAAQSAGSVNATPLSERQWQTLVSLAQDWCGTYPDLVRAACSLS